MQSIFEKKSYIIFKSPSVVILNTSFNEVTANQQQQHTTTKATTKQPHEAENMLKKVKDTN